MIPSSFTPTLFGQPDPATAARIPLLGVSRAGLKQAGALPGTLERGFAAAARWPVMLFDQQNDIAEKTDVAGTHPEIACHDWGVFIPRTKRVVRLASELGR